MNHRYNAMAFFCYDMLETHGHGMLKHSDIIGAVGIVFSGRLGCAEFAILPLTIELFVEIDVQTISIERIDPLNVWRRRRLAVSRVRTLS
jgi:hypothetical protein